MFLGSDGAPSPGVWLRRRREAARLTQEELADRSGLSVRAISNLERGRTRRPHPSSLRLLARILSLPDAEVNELLARYRTSLPGEPDALEAAVLDGEDPTAAPRGSPAAGIAGVVPRQLPVAVASFAGRTAEQETLEGWLKRASHSGADGAVVISAIGGMAGVGKTALAVHWAHRVADRFPDGQLYANLRGYDPSGQPADPAEIVRGFLLALGAMPELIPASLDDQAALFRSMLAGRRVLIVADNARDPEQVRPLLPGTPGSMVLVTSRSQLGGLVAAEGARLLNLDVLSEADAAELLSARLGADRVAAEPEAVAELIRLCARLPLALAIVAARADLSNWPLAVLTAQLAQARERLGLLGLDDSTADLRTVFSWSYRHLSGEAARMFRMLAVHPGPDISVPAAASLTGISVTHARAALRELVAASMAAERVPGRFSLHDLLRAYAAELARAEVADGERDAAASAMLQHYLHTAMAAAHALDPALPAPVHPAAQGAIADRDQALAWLAAEHDVLLAVIAQAGRAGSDDYARQIAWTLEPVLDARGYWKELAACEQTALDCSARLADRAGQARAHLYLGRALARLGDRDRARPHLEQAVTLFQALGDLPAEARALLGLSALCTGGLDLDEAMSDSLRALRIAEAEADLTLEAHASNNVGYFCALRGDAGRGLAYCRRALDLCRQLGNTYTEACTSDSLGYIYRQLGEYGQATASYRRAMSLFQAMGARYLSAQSLTHLGDCHQEAGDIDAAQEALRQAQSIFDSLGHPEASQLRRKLIDLY